MQGTIVMLMALSGLGCHHKKVDVAYAPACYTASYGGGCYGGGCYGGVVAPVSFAGCYGGCYGGGFDGCYGGCYGGGCYGGGCYGGGCYGGCFGGKHRRGGGLFGGLFGHKRRAAVFCCDAGYGLPVYGSYTPVYGSYAMGAPIVSGQAMPYATGQGYSPYPAGQVQGGAPQTAPPSGDMTAPPPEDTTAPPGEPTPPPTNTQPSTPPPAPSP